jgi:hypothetical protein
MTDDRPSSDDRLREVREWLAGKGDGEPASEPPQIDVPDAPQPEPEVESAPASAATPASVPVKTGLLAAWTNRKAAAEVLGLTTRLHRLALMQMQVAGEIDGHQVSITWSGTRHGASEGGDRRGTVTEVWFAGEIQLPGFEVFPRVVHAKGLRGRTVERPDDWSVQVMAKHSEQLDDWLTPARREAIASTSGSVTMNRWGIRHVAGRHLNNPNEIISLVQNLVATAKVLAGE